MAELEKENLTLARNEKRIKVLENLETCNQQLETQLSAANKKTEQAEHDLNTLNELIDQMNLNNQKSRMEFEQEKHRWLCGLQE